MPILSIVGKNGPHKILGGLATALSIISRIVSILAISSDFMIALKKIYATNINRLSLDLIIHTLFESRILILLIVADFYE